jgi:hypothetical protein
MGSVPGHARHPARVVEHVLRPAYARRRELPSPWRRSICFHQALLTPVLTPVHLRTDPMLAQVAAGFGISIATAGRYVTETIELLADRVPRLRASPRELPPQGLAVLGGTLIVADHRPPTSPAR